MIAYRLGQLQALYENLIELFLKRMSVQKYNQFWDDYCRGANGEAPRKSLGKALRKQGHL